MVTTPPDDGARDVEGFASLAELALDLRSSWTSGADTVWHRLDHVPLRIHDVAVPLECTHIAWQR